MVGIFNTYEIKYISTEKSQDKFDNSNNIYILVKYFGEQYNITHEIVICLLVPFKKFSAFTCPNLYTSQILLK